MQIKHIARISFASRRAAKKKGNLAIRRRMFGKIVIDHERMPARIAEMLAERRAGVGCDKLKRSRIGSRRGDDRRVSKRGLLLEFCSNSCDGRSFLPNRNINTIDRLYTTRSRFRRVRIALIDDSVDSNGSFSRLPITDNKLALPAANGNHPIDSLDACLQWLFYRLALHDTERLALDGKIFIRLEFGAAIDRNAEWIDYSAQHIVRHRHGGNAARTANGIAFFYERFVAKEHRAYVILFEIERHAENAV